MNEFVLPDYGGACLSNLLPSVASRLLGETPLLDVPRAARYVILLVDGLGWYPMPAACARTRRDSAARARTARVRSAR